MRAIPSQTTIILDACCVINLYASGRMEEILTALPPSIAITDYVRNSEALWVYGGPDDDIRSVKERINLTVIEKNCRIITANPNSEVEETTMVNYAYQLKDDGEAFTGAIAVNRGWVMATDDLRAKTFLLKQAPSLKIISTLELIKAWADPKTPSTDELRLVLSNIKTRATYKPHENHPLCAWWRKYVQE